MIQKIRESASIVFVALATVLLSASAAWASCGYSVGNTNMPFKGLLGCSPDSQSCPYCVEVSCQDGTCLGVIRACVPNYMYCMMAGEACGEDSCT